MNDDHATATVFRALSDPRTLQLAIDSLSAGKLEIDVGQRLGTTELAASSRLSRLVDAGLMRRTREGNVHVYHVSDPAGVELLLATARQLQTDPVADR